MQLCTSQVSGLEVTIAKYIEQRTKLIDTVIHFQANTSIAQSEISEQVKLLNIADSIPRINRTSESLVFKGYVSLFNTLRIGTLDTLFSSKHIVPTRVTER